MDTRRLAVRGAGPMTFAMEQREEATAASDDGVQRAVKAAAEACDDLDLASALVETTCHDAAAATAARRERPPRQRRT